VSFVIEQDDLSSKIYERIHRLARMSAEHSAVKNSFYDLWISQELDADSVELVAVNFYARVQRTPIRIALAFLHMTDLAARAETVENLYDEMGLGDGDKAHSTILRRFWETLLGKLRGHVVNLEAVRSRILPSTAKLIEESERLFSNSSPQVVCGALLAQEWHAYPQLVRLYEGVRNYRQHYEFEEFHENCEYFYLHIGATEKQHKIHSLSTAAKACRTLEDVADIEHGFNAYLDLLAVNWEEIYFDLRVAGAQASPA
jgi:pyrroloquinoline quinone (PQQ) biosynthesis protein C